MALITPTISNGISTIPARSIVYFVQPVQQITVKGISKTVLAGPARILKGITTSGRTLVAGDTWADVTEQLTKLGITPLPDSPSEMSKKPKAGSQKK